MATKLYFRAATSTVAGTLPASNASISATSPSQIGDSGTNRSMNTTKGSSQTSIAITTAANINAQPSLIGRFVSDRLASQTFALTSVGDISLSIGGSESNAASNFQIRISLATWRPSTGAIVTRIHDLATNATLEPGTTETSLTATNAAGGTSATVADGDVLICEIWRDSTVQANATARTNTIFYDGTTEASTTTNAAFINFPNDTLLFAPQQFVQSQAKINAFGVQGYTQSQANVKQTYYQFTQSQADIKTSYQQYTQSQSDIKQTYVQFTQSQAYILPVQSVQSQGAITTNVFTLSDTFTRSIGSGLGSADAGGTYTYIQDPATFSVNGTQGSWDKVDNVDYYAILGGVTASPINTVSLDVIVPTRFGAFSDGEVANLTIISGSTNTVAYGTGIVVSFINGSIKVFPQFGSFLDSLAGTFSDSPGQTWRIILQIHRADSNNTIIRGKLWNTASTEPVGWSINTAHAIADPFNTGLAYGHPELIFSSTLGSSGDPIVFDNYSMTAGGWTQYAQSQASIKATGYKFTQSQAHIVSTTQQFMQSQAKIKGVGIQSVQSQALIATYISWASNNDDGLTYLSLHNPDPTGASSTSQGNTTGTPPKFITSGGIQLDTSPLNAITIGGRIRVHVSMSESGAGANVGSFIRISTEDYLNRNITTVAEGSYGSELPVENPPTHIQDWTFTPSSPFTLNTGDKLRILIGYDSAGGVMTAGFSVFFSYGRSVGHGDDTFFDDSFVEFTEQITEQKINLISHTQSQAKIRAFGITKFMQSQAYISGANQQYTQSQAYIKTVDNCQFMQFQATILATEQQFAQSQADIKQTYQQYLQSQSDIKQVYTQFTQSQADILAIEQQYLQSQADIKSIEYQFTQSQADILATEQQYLQSQADIKAVNYQFVQSQANIKQEYQQYLQSQAWILVPDVTQFAQSQADIKQTYTQYVQSQADISQTYYQFTQSQGTILAPNQQYVQSQADIVTTNNQYVQSQAEIKQEYQQYLQSQGTVKQTYYQFTQSQGKINAFDVNQYLQSQALIAGSFVRFMQSQAKINAFDYPQWMQSQADILAREYAFTQSQAWIVVTTQKYAQSQADILQTYNQFVQSQADIKQTYYQFTQSQAHIKQTNQQYVQSQGAIKTTTQQYVQSQSYIHAYDVTQFTQSQALITSTGKLAFTQSQADIKTVNYQNTQSQGAIKVIAYQHTQSQAWIKRSNFAHTQSQADINATNYQVVQSQADIKTLDNTQFVQSQSDIKQVYRFSVQSQGSIKQTYQSYTQSQSHIVTTVIAVVQSQAFIALSMAFMQSQALIKAAHTLKNVTVSDEHTLSISVDDIAENNIILNESTISVIMSDDAEIINLTVSDDIVIILILEDEAY